MIKLRGTRGDREFILLGLSEGNIAKLKEGKPIAIFREDLGIGVDVLIYYGATENAIIDELKALGVALPEPTTPTRN